MCVCVCVCARVRARVCVKNFTASEEIRDIILCQVTCFSFKDDPVPSTSDEAVNGKRGRKNPSIRDLSPPTETFGDAGYIYFQYP